MEPVETGGYYRGQGGRAGENGGSRNELGRGRNQSKREKWKKSMIEKERERLRRG